MNPNEIDKLSRKHGIGWLMSVVLNWFWAVLFLPATFFGAISSMNADSLNERTNRFTYFALTSSVYILFVTPVIIAVAVILSFVFRRKQRYWLAVKVQLVPIATILIGVVLAIMGFHWQG